MAELYSKCLIPPTFVDSGLNASFAVPVGKRWRVLQFGMDLDPFDALPNFEWRDLYTGRVILGYRAPGIVTTTLLTQGDITIPDDGSPLNGLYFGNLQATGITILASGYELTLP